MNKRNIQILATVVLVAGALVFLVRSSQSEVEYYKHVDELLDEPEKWESRTLRVHGFVQAGSLDEAIVGQSTKRTFILEYNGQQVKVRNEGPKPDNFRDLAEVVAKGKLTKEDGEYVLDASELSAKCPSKYEGAERTKDYGGTAPRPNTAGQSRSSKYGQ
ncbi:MAG: cytochrome c maturation protein CcmE [Deltaproteobacteria bacterium]|nr:cytochrome c maturation protein CcmE [Deltaproteobacteria bacterium]